MSNPLFSIVIPTRGRSHIVRYAIESVLRQTFKDFEVVLVDNDLSDATASVCKKYLDDSRFRYHRTGNLSMPDNWEYGLNHSTGHFFLLIEDKMFLSKHALTRLKLIFEKENPDFLVWKLDHYDEKHNRFRPRPSSITSQHQWMESDTTLRLVAQCDFKEYWPLAPRGFNFASSRDNIRKAAQRHPDGKFFVPVAPDFTSGYALLLTFKKYLLISSSISAHSFASLSNGQAQILKQELGMQFYADLGGPADIAYKHTLIKCNRCYNSIINDFLGILPHFQRTNDFTLDLVEYFLMNWQEIMFALTHGGNMAEEIQAYFNALELLDDKAVIGEIQLRMQKAKRFGNHLSSRKTLFQRISREVSNASRKLFYPKNRFASIDAFLDQY